VAVNKSLQGQLRKRLLLALTALLFLSGLLSYSITKHYANQVYDRWLYDSVNSLAQQVRYTGGRAALDLPRIAQEMFEWDDDDKTLFRVVGSQSGHIAGYTEAPASALQGTTFRNAVLFEATVRGQDMRWAAIELDLQPAGERVTVLVGETTKKRRALADEVLISVWLPQVILFLVVIGVMLRIVSSHAVGIRSLSVRLLEFTHQTLDPLPATNVPQELLPLLSALNELLAKLKLASAAQRSFIANAAHQLRTPLTALRLQAEHAVNCDNIEEMRASVLKLQLAADRATRLANQLLLLSRAEPHPNTELARREVDLYQLAFGTASAWVPEAIDRHIDLGFDENSKHVILSVDETLVGEAINNLLDNALKYCPAGSKVTVSVTSAPEPAIVVEDNGPGISSDERTRVVNRFYRGDNKSNTRIEGSGLGLAIVQEVASAHGGRLVITEADGGGTRCEIHFLSMVPGF
jgi:two-component system, OmpR family, sensor histidine kinase TctE